MSNLTVSTIIVSYNTADLTVQAIESVLENYNQDSIAGEVIVVDNNSHDDSVPRIRKQFGKTIKLIENKKNTGFAAANNQAIAIAQGKYYFLLNSDTILKPHALHHLLEVFTQYPEQYQTEQLAHTATSIDRVGIVSGQLLNPDGSIQPQGIALPNLLNITTWWLWPFPGDFPLLSPLHSYHYQKTEIYTKRNMFGWVAGTAMLIKREVIEEIGLLDEAIFMYAEDVEFCLRARKHHWDIVFTPSAQIIHFGSASSSKDNAAIKEIQGLQYIFAKHQPIWQSQLIHVIFRIGAWLRWLLFGIILNNVEKKSTYSKILQALKANRVQL